MLSGLKHLSLQEAKKKAIEKDGDDFCPVLIFLLLQHPRVSASPVSLCPSTWATPVLIPLSALPRAQWRADYLVLAGTVLARWRFWHSLYSPTSPNGLCRRCSRHLSHCLNKTPRFYCLEKPWAAFTHSHCFVAHFFAMEYDPKNQLAFTLLGKFLSHQPTTRRKSPFCYLFHSVCLESSLRDPTNPGDNPVSFCIY